MTDDEGGMREGEALLRLAMDISILATMTCTPPITTTTCTPSRANM